MVAVNHHSSPLPAIRHPPSSIAHLHRVVWWMMMMPQVAWLTTDRRVQCSYFLLRRTDGLFASLTKRLSVFSVLPTGRRRAGPGRHWHGAYMKCNSV
jgi:hypothetical protein